VLDMVHFSALSLGMVHHMPVIDLKLGLVSGRELIDTDTLKVLICLIRILNGIQRGLLSFHFYHVMQESQQYPIQVGRALNKHYSPNFRFEPIHKTKVVVNISGSMLRLCASIWCIRVFQFSM